MPRFSRRLLVVLTGLPLLSACFRIGPPSSAFNGLYSTSTGTRLQPHPIDYNGFPDDRVLYFSSRGAACPVAKPKFQSTAMQSGGRLPSLPGILLIGADWGIDEAEIPNQEWRQYELAGGSAAARAPRPEALPQSDYYTDPFYLYYPVVGISREQAAEFCRWRSRVVTREINKDLHHPDSLSTDYVRCTYRLPTEAEWEQAAALSAGGSTCLEMPLRVEPRAAAYLQRRSGSRTDVACISADIKAYNATQPLRSIINYDQAEPYFLRLATPGYVYQGPSNAQGLYQALGNVAELVQEPGITKGGSYQDPLAACTLKARGSYRGPAPTVGFRCVCTVSYPNRK
ncbi:formylglycine-generating enzyme family protein [Hymenobacter edaphi]|uniref:Sulfatase-modifying factor enzyme-like domain-containing protein n=1 Tax=Hymenobacter edaphi TaxID=2211146 RepID=A0A328BV64_9BACT|nr:SUMF1/EgtB/PvdO family nonheme iron enzyme [Hymenobacter edaphi]RAK69754.1 hypothetical protein DLM85_02560 [Hymenobacter edaphi]